MRLLAIHSARPCALIVALMLPTAAMAHTDVETTSGLLQGFLHPFGGLDHLLAMVTVGMFAATLGGRAVWAVLATFMTVMAIGGALGVGGVALPYVEAGIALSVVVLGLAVAFSWRAPMIGAIALVGAFAAFHGHAHGAEIGEGASILAYGGGFIIATGLLHAAGVAIGRLRAWELGQHAVAVAGAAVAATGLALTINLAL